MADIHDSKQVGHGSRETRRRDEETTPPGSGVAGRFADIDIERVDVGTLSERVVLFGLTAAMVGVSVLAILGLVAVAPGNVATGLLAVVALFGVAAAAPSLAGRTLARLLSRDDRSDSE